MKAEVEDDPEDDDEADPAEPAEKDETDEEKSERLAKLDKVKSHKHLAKAVDRHKKEIADFEKREKEHTRKQAMDDRVNQAVTEKYGPYAQLVDAYGNKDYRNTAKLITGLLKDDFPTIAKNIWNATKDGMTVADLKHELNELKSKIADKTGTAPEAAPEKTPEATTGDTTDAKQLRATFDKRVKGHELTTIGDAKLSEAAFARWRESWDEDLGEYSLSSKKAADLVLAEEKDRAARVLGKRRARETTKETRDEAAPKQLKDMSKEERVKYFTDKAVREASASRRERERRA